MATKFKFEIESDGLTPSQTLAFRTFIGTLGGTEFLEQIRQGDVSAQQDESVETSEPAKKKRASRAKAEEVQAEEVQAEEVQAEEVQAEEVQAEEVQAEEVQAEEPQAEEPQAEEPQAEEPQAEEPQAEETKTSAFSIQDVRDRVKEKQGKWRTSIKAELERLGSSSVSLLDPAHFEEFCNFMDNLA